MRSAYNETWLYNLHLLKETKRWLKASLIDADQFKRISETYTSAFYHPNFIIRILIFVATLIGLSGATGLLALLILDTNESVVSILCLLYGVGSFILLDKALIKNSKHYKSGLTEALMYHSCVYTIGGFGGLVDFGIIPMLIFSIAVLTFTAYRYLDLLTTISAILTLGYLLFFQLYETGGIFQQIIPFMFIICFTLTYFISHKLKSKNKYSLWINNLLIIESISLLTIYLAGNYLVVRELSINLMNLELAKNEDIPFAFIFYAFTILFPLIYLYFGIKNKDRVLLRVSLLVLAFSVFTFKYYYGFDRPEITLTIAGVIMTGIALILFNYLKFIRNGFTRENILSEKWTSMNAEAFIISQTLGGNQVNQEQSFQGEGGSFGGGGSSGSFKLF